MRTALLLGAEDRLEDSLDEYRGRSRSRRLSARRTSTSRRHCSTSRCASMSSGATREAAPVMARAVAAFPSCSARTTGALRSPCSTKPRSSRELGRHERPGPISNGAGNLEGARRGPDLRRFRSARRGRLELAQGRTATGARRRWSARCELLGSDQTRPTARGANSRSPRRCGRATDRRGRGAGRQGAARRWRTPGRSMEARSHRHLAGNAHRDLSRLLRRADNERCGRRQHRCGGASPITSPGPIPDCGHSIILNIEQYVGIQIE